MTRPPMSFLYIHNNSNVLLKYILGHNIKILAGVFISVQSALTKLNIYALLQYFIRTLYLFHVILFIFLRFFVHQHKK